MNDVQIADDAPQLLQELLNDFETPLVEVALMADTSVSELRAYQERHTPGQTRITEQDTPLSALSAAITRHHSLAALLRHRYKIPVDNIRAFLVGRSAYLNEQRPAILWRNELYDLVEEAAIAYATGRTPEEFLDKHEIIPTVDEDLS